MSDIQQLKLRLLDVSSEARQAAGGLASFKMKFSQHGAQVQSLIAGSATGADRDITELLDAASKAVEHAVQALEIASNGCRSYADQI